jgi:hypothetical protein
MHISINKAGPAEYYWFLLNDNGNEIHRTGHFPNEKTCELNALSFRVVMEFRGKKVTVGKAYEEPGVLLAAG